MNQKAPTKGKILAEIAPLLQYPGSDYKLKLENVIAVLAANCPAAVSPLEDFKKQIATLSTEDLEELYTRTFDVAPLASPYISVHIYGDENFDRGNLMATLATKFEEHGFEHENELPDHLALLLKFSGYLSEEELKELEKAYIALIKSVEEKNIEKIIRWDSRFHDVLLSASKNPRLVKVNAVLIEQVHRFRKSYIEDITTAKYIVHSHKKILDALKSRDPEISRACAMEHIREVKEFILDKYKKKAR